MKLNTKISIELDEHTYNFNTDLIKYDNLLNILQFKDTSGDEVYYKISKSTTHSFLRTLEVLYNNGIEVSLCADYRRYLRDKWLELEFSKLYEIEDTVYLDRVVFLDNKVYVLAKSNLIELDVTELEEDTDFINLIKEKYYKLGE